MVHILYQDAQILVANKPSGLLSQPGRTVQDSLHYRLLQRFPSIELLHRLDQHTSGIMVFALTVPARKSLAKQFQDRTLSKAYEALVWGNMPSDKGCINMPLRCDWPNRPRQEVHSEGKNALTHWQVKEQFTVHGFPCNRIALTPVTGRSHQLRVHMAHLGHPILGDNLYAHPEALALHERLCLHAHILRFNHPITGKRMQFVCDPDF